MNILIFGATGGTGRQIVAQALERRHSVTAFVRDTARLQVAHPLLRCVVGDAMDLGSVGTALQDQDAVLCALGTMPEAKGDRSRRQPGVPVCSVGTRNIIQAMLQHSVRRLVVETSASVGDSRQAGRFGAGIIIRLLLRDVMEDKERQEMSVRDSALDWTIIRPVRLSDAARSDHVRSGKNLAWGLTSAVSRPDVAAVMLDALHDAGTLKSAITVLS